MAPSRQNVSPFAVDEKVFCFHHEMLYEARVLQSDLQPDGWKYKIHYKGWKNTWDDWVGQDRVRKFNEENKELAMALKDQIKALQQKSTKTGKKTARTNGSDFGSTRGSEERTAAAATTGRGGGARRQRDYELETVSVRPSSVPCDFRFPCVLSCLLLRKGCRLSGELPRPSISP